MLTAYYTCITLVYMNSTVSLENVIDYHTRNWSPAAELTSVAHHVDVDNRRRWARARQDRFDAAGLPRGLARVV